MGANIWQMWVIIYITIAFALTLLLRSRITPEIRRLAESNEYIAIGLTLSHIGVGAIWPITLIAFAILKLRTERGQIKNRISMMEVERQLMCTLEGKLESPPGAITVEGLSAELASIEPWPPSKCAGCCCELADPTWVRNLTRFEIHPAAMESTQAPRALQAPQAPQIEQYELCDECFDALAEGLNETRYGVIDAEFEDEQSVSKKGN